MNARPSNNDPTVDENGEPFIHSTFPPDRPEEGGEDGNGDRRNAGA